MYKRTLFMLMAAFVFWGIATPLHGPAFGLEPMLAQSDAEDPLSDEEPVLAADASMVLYSTEQIMMTRKALSDIFAAGPRSARTDEGESQGSAGDSASRVLFSTERIMLARDDGDLSNIYGAGARMDDTSERESQDAADGLTLALDDSGGPSIDAGGPALALDDSGGPSIDNGDGPALDNGGDDASAAAQDSSPTEIPKDQEALYREVRELREAVDKLREEAETRQQLRVTEEETRDEEKEILEAAGREYTLRPSKTISVNLSANYSYNDYDVIRQLQEQKGTRIEHRSNHNITSVFSLETGLRDNLSIDASVPFVYKYDKVDTAQSMDATGIGDASVGLKYQPLKTGQGYPAPIFSIDYTWPTGKSSFEINPNTELSTGSGFHEITGGVSVSQPFDPVNAFASLRYLYRLRETNIGQRRGRGILDEVNPGDRISVSLGFGYAVSYRMSLSLSLSTSYSSTTDYYWLARNGRDKTSSEDNVSASLSLNTSWRVTPKRTVVIGIGKGLTTANPGFSLSVRLPVTFRL